MSLGILIGPAIGGMLDPLTASLSSSVIGVLCMLYVVLLLPESLSPHAAAAVSPRVHESHARLPVTHVDDDEDRESTCCPLCVAIDRGLSGRCVSLTAALVTQWMRASSPYDSALERRVNAAFLGRCGSWVRAYVGTEVGYVSVVCSVVIGKRQWMRAGGRGWACASSFAPPCSRSSHYGVTEAARLLKSCCASKRHCGFLP